MVGTIIIDGIDVTTSFGIFIRDGGYEGIVRLPQIKDPELNDWHEENGIEVDLSDLKLKSKEFDIKFGTVNRNADIDGFMNLITNGVYHNFTFPDLQITKTLRLISSNDYKGTVLRLRVFSLVFSEDEPMSGYIYQAPLGGAFPVQGYQIDGIDLSQYGLAVLDRTDDDILKAPAIKQNLQVDISSINGVVYDSNHVRMQAKEVRLNLLMRADNPQVLSHNLNAFLYDLIRPGERQLYFKKNEETYKFYYKSSSVNKLVIINRIWCEFSITICFITYYPKRYIYLFKQTGKVKADDNSYSENDSMILLSKIASEKAVEEVIEMNKIYNETTGKITIQVTSTEKELELNHTNGKIIIQ